MFAARSFGMLRRSSSFLAAAAAPAKFISDDELKTIPQWKLTVKPTKTVDAASVDGNATGVSCIERTFQFQDFHQAWSFMSTCVPFINQQDHHPEWFNVYNRVEVRLTTHDLQGLGPKDLALATHMDTVATSVAAPKK